ncbi:MULTISPECIES: transglutaminaseTgpA domain-containing protein [unclassified Moraxella]|uniref:transglutaminase family protein n=1 Tax=unclassified Moraxella TaxID=2685852 RepID=UPI003AF9BBE5
MTTQPLISPSLSKSTLRSRFASLSAYQWVLISQLFVVIPHAKNLPAWLLGYALVIILMQLPPLRQWFPSILYRPRTLRMIQYVGFIGSLFGLYLTYRTAFGLDVGIAFLLLCAVSKLLELHTRRDAYVVLSLSMFVLAGLFLVDQNLTTTLIVALGAMMVLFAMISLNDDGTGRYRTLGLLVAQAIPLTIVLFLFFPRLPPLWSVQLSGKQATTGMSDTMSPGDFANLSQSTELAFRVEFAGQTPNRSQLYWRGLVFSDFDGITWRASRLPPQFWLAQQGKAPDWLTQTLNIAKPPQPNDGKSYRVILERTGQPWLFGLDYPITQQRGIGLSSDFTLRYWDNVNQRLTYNAYQINDAPIDLTLSDTQRQINLALPATGNPQSQQFARQLFEQVGRDPIRYVNAIQQWIHTQNFRYTLSPPLLKDNRIDEFLFATRAGFCEHYSSSFTYLMRSAGIPARVVVGYQGGELGRDGKSWEVRQMDAHAWSEIWVEGRGWVRIDPTAFIAPERVEKGMDNLTQTAGAMMFGDGVAGQISYQQFQMLQQARRLFDQASYYWQRDVVGYDQDSQKSSMLKWFNIQSVYQQVMIMFGGIVMLVSLVALMLWWQRRKVWDKTDVLMVQLSQRLAKQDKSLARAESEGVLHWLNRIQGEVTDVDNVKQLSTIYRHARYAKAVDIDKNNKEIKTLVEKIKLRARS